jgi:hypothetical protein
VRLTRLPCGCRIGERIERGERQFVVEPCSLKCEYYLYVVRECYRQDKPVQWLFDRDR